MINANITDDISNKVTRTGDIPILNFAPRTDWSEMSETEHFVQFYEADAFLLNSLSGYIGTAVNAGEGAVVVATKAHREGLDELLRENGLDVATASVSGLYVSIDAAETLSTLMVDGLPEPKRFREVIGSLIAKTRNGRPRLRAFGEMVALLWADGNYPAAIRLEELWNDLQKTHNFSLFCAYPMNGFNGEKLVAPHSGVCSVHSRVIPSESYADLPNPDARLRAIAQLQQKARSLEAEIKERGKAEERLRASLVREQMARAEAESANRMKDEFLATVSHELRTPLSAIIGWAHMLRKGRLDEATRGRALETIERNAKSQAQLVEDILDVSRVITGKLQLNNGPVDMASVINSAVDSVQLAADAKDIHLEVILDPSARLISGDAGRLQQVVWNLLSNAIKFTPSAGRVEVKLERVGSNVQIRLSDTGPGIEPDFLPFIFDRFRQADSTSTRRHSGLGLGLAIVRHLVELHGGTVKAENKQDSAGAVFVIELPLSLAKPFKGRKRGTEAQLPKETLNSIESLPSLEGVRVLLVDDDQDTLQILSVLLTDLRAKVQAASSAFEAIEMLEWYKPDVMVSDLAMPGEDGYSLIAKIRATENGRFVPAVALTAYVRVEDRVRALSAGFNMFVPKPVEPTELVAAIANLAETAN
ncbi:MAG: hybrid sensor histidine kinase/response regulator [Pyrinomonadaceae bacterium]